MQKIIVSNIKFFLSASALMLVLCALGQTAAFAGNQPTGTKESTGSIKTLRSGRLEEKQLAAAQMRNERHPPNSGAGLRGGDSETRTQFSFFAAVAFLIAGIWTLFVLLLNFLGKNIGRDGGRLRQFRRLATQPSFAFSVFGFSFVAVIVGGQLTSPPAVSAEKINKNDRSQLFAPASPASKAIFKSARQIGDGDGITQTGTPVFDQQGNQYVRGGFSRTLTVGATTLTASRDFDLFFAKYDADGDALWARQGSGGIGAIPARLADEGATVLAVDGFGNVYVGGSFVKSITLQGGANANITLNDGGGAGINYESFIAKYDSNGNLLWARGGNSGSPQNANNLEIGQNAIDQIVVGADGNLYVAGLVSGSRFFGETFAGGGRSDILLTKLDAATGAPVWKQIIGGTDDDNGLDLKIDGAGNLYLMGNFTSTTITFPNGTTFSNPDTDPAEDRSVNTFVAKFNANGTNLWVKNLDNTETLGGAQIALNAAGEIFLTGYFFDVATFDSIVLTENEGSGENEASFGGYLAKMDSSGNFIWAKSFGGLGESITLDGAGRIYVAGTFWDSGTFGAGETNQESLASFGGEDLFVARFGTGGNLDWAKPIAASGINGQIIVGNPSDPENETRNTYNPLGIAYNPARGTMFVSGDFEGAVALDCQTLVVQGSGTHSYVAELSADGETTNCRIWNGLDIDDNNWDSPDNWNGGVLPNPNDSVYVPYTGNNFDAPDYNPGTNKPITNLSVADDRILTLKRDLNINTRLALLGGNIDAGSFTLSLGAFSESLSINDGRVLGRVRKQFFGEGNSFTFPVGTENGYSPVTLSNINAGKGGSFAVTAHQGAYPNQATDLPGNRAARWWNLTNGGLFRTDITFKYLAEDINAGIESQYRAYRIPSGGGTATLVGSTINTAAKTVTAANVMEFSDWTLAQPVAPTAANVTISGRVMSGYRPLSNARVSLTDQSGISRVAMTNASGYYFFADVAAEQTVILEARYKLCHFVPRVVSVNEAVENLILSAQ